MEQDSQTQFCDRRKQQNSKKTATVTRAKNAWQVKITMRESIKTQCLENIGHTQNRCETIQKTKNQQIEFR